MNGLRDVLASCIRVQAEPSDLDVELDRMLDDRIEQLETRLMREHDEAGPEARACIAKAAGISSQRKP